MAEDKNLLQIPEFILCLVTAAIFLVSLFLVSDQPISLGLKYKDISLTTNSLPVVTGLVLIVAVLIFWKRKGTSCEERIERLSREHSERLERLMTEQDKKIQKVLIGAEGRAEEVVRG